MNKLFNQNKKKKKNEIKLTVLVVKVNILWLICCP